MVILANIIGERSYNVPMYKTGLFVGAFCPPHAGHLYVGHFAEQFVDELFVVLHTNSADTIPTESRYEWLRELFPLATVLKFDGTSEALPAWLQEQITIPIDNVFGSDTSCRELAEAISAKFIPVDPDRTVVPISGKQLRNNPLEHWDYLPSCVRPHFVKRVCVFGPESTGKSTLAVELANHFKTLSVPEWPRTMISDRNDELLEADFPIFARGQAAAEDALARQANRLLICDTDAIITSIWSDWLYGKCDQSILDLAEKRQYDLYLLTDVDVPWVQDPQRYLPEKRKEFFDKCKNELEKRGREYVVVRGDWKQRFEIAVQAVQERCLKLQRLDI